MEFVFYLDANKNDMMCRIAARYGETEYSVLDAFRREEDSLQDTGRMLEEERNALIVASHYFPEVDEEKDELLSREDPDGIYDFLESGMELLAQIGEIRATNRFRNLHIIKKPKVSLGVSVSQGLLDLKVDTDEIEADELKSLLKSLRLRKKYYRLKNGTFIHLEDNNLDMLSEMMDALHLSEKDLAGGELHLPIYRSLYLDKLLEENESVYTSRDSHFKEIVKNFRAVSDANFDEPDTLKSVLRSYQKKGYKWLRTLESYGFGGILADDMGLGKTVQMLSALLSCVQREKTRKPSLIVAPT